MEQVMRDVGLVVAAGGSATRYGAGRNKLFEPLNGLPVFCHCLRRLIPPVLPENSVLVVPLAEQASFTEALATAGRPGMIRLVSGGATRQESVLAGLEALPETVRIAAIQDAARPLTTAKLLARCVDSARRHGSGVAARRVSDTIKIADSQGRVHDTPDRNTLWAAETPQVFERTLITEAYRTIIARHITATDDARAVELCGNDVYLVEHTARNPKLTYQSDLAALETEALP